MNRQDVATLEIPREVVKRVEDRLSHTEWDTPEAYVTNVIEEVLFHVETEMDDTESQTVEEEAVKERLMSLGYIDE